MQTQAVTTTSYDNLTRLGSAYPLAKKPRGQSKRVKLSENELFSDTETTTSYQTKGTADGHYTVVLPTMSHEQEFEAAGELTVNVSLQPLWYQANFDLQIDGVTYAAAVRNGGTTGPRLEPAGPHKANEIAGAGNDLSKYTIVIGGDCDAQGNITLVPGDRKTCTITNVLKESIQCSVFDDATNYSRQAGPSDAIFISGRKNEQGMACIPSGQLGKCHKAFGHCHTVETGEPVYFNLFDDGYSNIVGPTDGIFIQDQSYQRNSGASKACLADGICRKWFGPAPLGDGRAVNGAVFDDGNSNPAGPSDAVFIPFPIPGPGEACIPSPTPTATCRRWFGSWNAHRQ